MNPQGQSNNDPNGSFFDPKTLIAIVLVGLVWMAWQSYLQEKYPDAYKNQAQVEGSADSSGTQQIDQATGKPVAAKANDAAKLENNSDGSSAAAASATNTKPVPNTADYKERIVTYEDEVWKLELSSKGMGFKTIKLKGYTDRKDELVKLGDTEGYLPFETNIVGRQVPLDFTIKQTDRNTFVGVAQRGGLNIQKTIVLDPLTYSFDVDIQVSNIQDEFAGLVNFLSLKLYETESSFFMPATGMQEFYTAHSGTTDREYLMFDQSYRGSFGNVRISSLSEQYFGLAMIDSSDVIPELNVAVDPSTATALARLNHSVINRSNTYNVKYKGFAGPKDVNLLQKVDAQMTDIVDFGWFSWLAIHLYNLMTWFYSLFGNWGIAIVLLTILVRIVVLPFHMMSYKSMKGMQEIQPQLKALREKYKDDQQRLQQETMAFMKEHKVNPLGGCLPMLLQFPVFIALYRMFSQVIDLYKAPMGLWITDLSLKDPYYILPVVMGAVFFLQTKLTPSTMDPNQQKIMLIMPVMFAFFMAGLPSALTLYMCVSTIFGCAQQLYVMRDKKKVPTQVEAKA